MSRRKVIAWALWDWGTQPFFTVITTFVFAVYLVSEPFGNHDERSLQLSLALGVSGLFIAALAPVLGQSTDRSGRRMFHLRWQTWLLAGISGAMYFVAPQPHYFWLGVALLGAGSIVAEIANVNYYSTLDQVSTPENVGRVSGFGWGLGYLGGIAVLLLILAALGTDIGATQVRLAMLICAAWVILFTIPVFVTLRDRTLPRPSRLGVIASYRQLGSSIMQLYRTSPNTLGFLAASALFRDGLAGVFMVGGLLASGTFGFTPTEVVIFGLAANICSGIATIIFGLLDDRFGPKLVILVSLGALVALSTALFFLTGGGKPVFWTLGLLLCLFVGPAQSASRTFLARLIPQGHSGELFGLYATTGRVISFLSPVMFAAFIWIGMHLTNRSEDSAQHWGIIGITLVLAAGFIGAVFVHEPPRPAKS